MDAASTTRWVPIASAQHGAISIRQLEDAGVTERMRRTLVARHILRLAAPRVYVLTGSPDTIERRQQTALLSLGPTAVFSHEAAARLHGFDRARPDMIELTVPRHRRDVASPYVLHSTHVLPDIDRVEIGGLPCTAATRTVIDLAALGIRPIRLEAAIDSAVRSGASSPDLLMERLTALRGHGRRGVRLLDRLLIDAGGHTMLERRFLTLMREAGLPRPRTQVVHRRNGRHIARVDFLFEEQGVVVEVSGRKGHSSPSDRARDAQRRNELQDAGRLVYEYTWEDVTGRAGHVQRTMQERLRAASPSHPSRDRRRARDG